MPQRCHGGCSFQQLYHILLRRLKIRANTFLKKEQHGCYGEVRIINSKGEMKIIKKARPPV